MRQLIRQFIYEAVHAIKSESLISFNVEEIDVVLAKPMLAYEWFSTFAIKRAAHNQQNPIELAMDIKAQLEKNKVIKAVSIKTQGGLCLTLSDAVIDTAWDNFFKNTSSLTGKKDIFEPFNLIISQIENMFQSAQAQGIDLSLSSKNQITTLAHPIERKLVIFVLEGYEIWQAYGKIDIIFYNMLAKQVQTYYNTVSIGELPQNLRQTRFYLLEGVSRLFKLK